MHRYDGAFFQDDIKTFCSAMKIMQPDIVFVDDEPQFVVARAAGASSEDNALTALVQQQKSRSIIH